MTNRVRSRGYKAQKLYVVIQLLAYSARRSSKARKVIIMSRYRRQYKFSRT